MLLFNNIKDQIATHEVPHDLKDLISLTIQIDNRNREHYLEKYLYFQDFSLTGSGPSLLMLPELEPMQVGQARLFQKEIRRRVAANGCLYCGKPGHFVKTCQLCLKGKNSQEYRRYWWVTCLPLLKETFASLLLFVLTTITYPYRPPSPS